MDVKFKKIMRKLRELQFKLAEKNSRKIDDSYSMAITHAFLESDYDKLVEIADKLRKKVNG